MSRTPMSHCFVAAEDYAELKRISIDGHTMASDYTVFAKKVQDFLDSVNNQGGFAVKVYIKPAELLAWCEERGRPVDSSARAAYSAHIFMTQDDN